MEKTAEAKDIPHKSENHNSELDLTVEHVVVPDKEIERWRKGVDKVAEMLKRFKPDLIVLPLKAAPFTFAVVEEVAKDRGIDIPLTVEINIGREHQDDFAIEYAVNNDDLEDEYDVKLERIGGIEEHKKEFAKWVNDTSLLEEESQKLVEVLETLGVGSVKSILIVDDTSYEGATLDIAAPSLVRRALEEVLDDDADEPSIESIVVMQNSDYMREIIRANFKDTEKIEEFFISQLIKGAVENENGEIVRIDEEPFLDEVGKYTEKARGSSPLSKLEEKYGREYLLNFRKRLIEELADNIQLYFESENLDKTHQKLQEE